MFSNEHLYNITPILILKLKMNKQKEKEINRKH